MKYPVNSFVDWEGKEYRVQGYEVHDGERFLVCEGRMNGTGGAKGMAAMGMDGADDTEGIRIRIGTDGEMVSR